MIFRMLKILSRRIRHGHLKRGSRRKGREERVSEEEDPRKPCADVTRADSIFWEHADPLMRSTLMWADPLNADPLGRCIPGGVSLSLS